MLVLHEFFQVSTRKHRYQTTTENKSYGHHNLTKVKTSAKIKFSHFEYDNDWENVQENYMDVQAGVKQGYHGEQMRDFHAYRLCLIAPPRNEFVGVTACTIKSRHKSRISGIHYFEGFNVRLTHLDNLFQFYFSRNCILVFPEGFDEGTRNKKNRNKNNIEQNMSRR